MSITLDLSDELVEKLIDLSKTTGETAEEIVRHCRMLLPSPTSPRRAIPSNFI